MLLFMDSIPFLSGAFLPFGEALAVLCCWLDVCGSRLSPYACLLLIAPLLVVVAMCMAHANWLHMTSFAVGSSRWALSFLLVGSLLHEGCSCFLFMGSCSLGSLGSMFPLHV